MPRKSPLLWIMLFFSALMMGISYADESILFYSVDDTRKNVIAEIAFPDSITKGSTIQYREPLDVKGERWDENWMDLDVREVERRGCVLRFKTVSVDSQYLIVEDYRECEKHRGEKFLILAVVISNFRPGVVDTVLGGIPQE